MNDLSRAAARGGPGAVMGSKNLKAIVVEGKERVEFDDKERFRFVQYEATKMLKANPITSQALPEFGQRHWRSPHAQLPAVGLRAR